MRLATLDDRAGGIAAIIIGTEVLDIRSALSAANDDGTMPTALADIFALGDGALDRLRKAHDKVDQSASIATRLREQRVLQPLAEVQLLAPIPRPGMILSCGANYKTHVAEMGVDLPKKPVAFLKNPRAVTGSGAPIRLPAGHDKMVDWEGEFCGVIGKSCHRVSPEAALDHVVGYTMIVDVSARDWARPFHLLPGMEAIDAWDMNLLGKQFGSFCPMGPAIVTKDELQDPANVRFTLSVNGEVKQSACTDDLVFSLAELIAYYSQWYTFEAGDIISTGSPAGVGFGMKPQQFLQRGDVVTLEAAHIGLLTNPVTAA